MKRAFFVGLAIIISIVFASAGLAADAAKSGAEPGAKATDTGAKAGKTHQLTGEITNVDAAAKTMAVKGKKGEETFDVSSVKNMDSLKKGEKVKVQYTEENGKMMAKSVKMASKKSAKKEKMG